MDKLEKTIADLNEIKEKIIPAIARMYGSGFSSVFACEKVGEKFDNAIELLKEHKADIEELTKQQDIRYDACAKRLELLKEQKKQNNKLDYLFSKIAGHSDYHGDSILTAITCIKEGKKIGNVTPKDGKQE